ncbi:MAG: hypothetical protein IT320_25810 [Anaerolineae bacterium]|nr:hypothetical protein [Anaerolineae bacterium]
MAELLDMLRTAMLLDAIPNALAVMYAIAASLARNGEDERAFEIVTMILQYPMHETLRVEAEILFEELELGLSPEVIAMANLRAEELTLDDMATSILQMDVL